MASPLVSAEAIELIHRIARQDRQAFSRFYDVYSGLAFTVALRILRSRADAEDLLQEVFVQIWNRAADYNPQRGKPEAWIITITKSRAIDKLRSLRRRQVGGSSYEDFSKNRTEELEQKGNIHSEVRLTVGGALDELSDVQKQALELAYFEGLTQSEIAERIDVPVGTVKTRIRDGLARLRAVLKTKSGETL